MTLTLELLKHFSDECLKLRRALYKGLLFTEMDALYVRSHVQLLLSDIEKFTSPEPGAPHGSAAPFEEPGASNTLQR